MKQVADRHRTEREFKVGDLVLIKLNPAQMRSRITSRTDTRLLRRYEGPVPIIAKVGKVAYKIQLPDWLHIHPIMHVSCLKPFHKDSVDPERQNDQRPPMKRKKSYVKELLQIADERIVKDNKGRSRKEYLIQWRFEDGAVEHRWEKEADLKKKFDKALQEFHKKKVVAVAD